ncbi:MAG TPA: aromatic-ring-hydroxylating dioxygenase subunit beta [Alphaproteobacteria bacterium]|jgi:benzoate/toluate 1,2-dioxygenase beta subunit
MSAPERSEIERLLIAEAELLDRGDYEAWLALFAEDGWYWVPASPDQANPDDHVSLFHENKALMRMRIERLRHPRAHGVALPVRTSRMVGNVAIDGAGGAGELVVRSRFHMAEVQDNRQRIFAGAYTHHLAPTEAGLRIRLKRVDLVNAEACHEAMQVFI